MNNPHPSNDPNKNPQVNYERQDVNVKAIAIFAIGLLVVIIAAMILIAGLMNSMQARTDTIQAVIPQTQLPTPPAPRLQPNPIEQTNMAQQLELLRATEEARLSTYGWVDRQAGVVHIPIERAMELVVEENQ
ncbi:MAG: hypothetical protein JW953_00295 [Anaerolineae bacterium]|nr:hypothetical protein [Anaerolineae bacterium]